MNIQDITRAKGQLEFYANRDFRPNQAEAIEYILNSAKRFCFLEAPTGSGKSLIAMVSGVVKGGTTYAVHSKILQTQIVSDFPEAESIFGRSNYECLDNEEVSCDECSNTIYYKCTGDRIKCDDRRCKHERVNSCGFKDECLYDVQKALVMDSKLRILNYDYLLSELNYVGKFGREPLNNFNIIDEADNLENTLVNFITLTFTKYALDRLGLGHIAESLKKTSKYRDELLQSWISFADEAHDEAKKIVDGLNYRIDNFKRPITIEQGKVIKERNKVKRLLEKITLFQNNVDETWVLDNQDDKYVFRPLWLTPELAEEFLWKHAKRWVLLSASFLPFHLECKRLGISTDDADYRILPSSFPVDRRTIYVKPVANLTNKQMDTELPKLIQGISDIMHTHPKEKGLIHAVSYKLGKSIMDGVASPRLVTHNSTNRQGVLNEFMESKEPLILVSPSMDRGVSLEMDLCRFIIVAKAPFLYLGDRVVQARVYSGRLGSEWYAATMLSTVLQMTGRGMRSDDDYCVSYILDEQFKRVYLQYPLFLPEWWRVATEF